MQVRALKRRSLKSRHFQALKTTSCRLRGVSPRGSLAELMASHLFVQAGRIGFARRFLCKTPPSEEEVRLKEERKRYDAKLASLNARGDKLRFMKVSNAVVTLNFRIRELEKVRFGV